MTPIRSLQWWMILFVLLLSAPIAHAQEPQSPLLDPEPHSLAICAANAAVSIDADEFPDLDATLKKWARDRDVTISEDARDLILRDYLCAEALQQLALPRTDPKELRGAGLDVTRIYLETLIQDESSSFFSAFSKRLGTTGLNFQPRPRDYRALEVTTDPPDAETEIDGKPVGRFSMVAIGTRHLVAKRSGYRTCRRDISVDSGDGFQKERCVLEKWPGR